MGSGILSGFIQGAANTGKEVAGKLMDTYTAENVAKEKELADQAKEKRILEAQDKRTLGQQKFQTSEREAGEKAALATKKAAPGKYDQNKNKREDAKSVVANYESMSKIATANSKQVSADFNATDEEKKIASEAATAALKTFKRVADNYSKEFGSGWNKPAAKAATPAGKTWNAETQSFDDTGASAPVAVVEPVKEAAPGILAEKEDPMSPLDPSQDNVPGRVKVGLQQVARRFLNR